MSILQKISQNKSPNHTKIAVVGLGVSGWSALNYLISKGYDVTVVDRTVHTLPEGVVGIFDDNPDLNEFDALVLSPGVAPEKAFIQNAVQNGAVLVNDIALFVDECQQKNIDIIAITGSNAKSTVTTLVGQMAMDAGIKTGVGGNLGTPALDLLNEDIKLAVLELSSFQLHIFDYLGDILPNGLSAQVATVLNFCPDHLDRHGDLQNYFLAKANILQGAKTVVVNAYDEHLYTKVLPLAQHASVITIGNEAHNFYIEDGALYEHMDATPKKLIDAQNLQIKGMHNLHNALFALAIGRAQGLAMRSMLQTLQNFKGLAHRCQFVKRAYGMDFFNDSKGTNVGATAAAIVGLGAVYGEKSLLLILGGQTKAQNFDALLPLCAKFAHAVYTIGLDDSDIIKALKGVDITRTKTLAYALSLAKDSGAKAVLFSPACASFDQFNGFAHRGEVFCALVEAL